MKSKILLIFLLMPFLVNSQSTPKIDISISNALKKKPVELSLDYHDSPLFKFRSWQDEKQFLWTSGLLIANGACKAQADILRDNYWYFKQVFPRANDQNWNPAISFQNKGPGFLNRTLFVWTSDWWHRFDTGHNLTLYVICVIPLAHINETLRLPARVIIARGLWDVGMRSVGYNSVDRLLYHHY